uniref:glutamine--tRNA ligase n=1 Tax=Strigamia maritima TaxID=126957 RepID=T1J7Y6_STRMM
MEAEAMISLFTGIGLSEDKAKDTIKNEAISRQLKHAIDEASKYCATDKISKPTGLLLYHIATKLKPKFNHFVPLLVKYCCENKIFNELRLQAAIDYLSLSGDENVDVSAFENACGVGVVVTPEQIEKVVKDTLQKHRDGLINQRYRYNVGAILGELKKSLKFADGKNLKNEVDIQVLDLLGAKTDEDLAKIKPIKIKPPVNETKSEQTEDAKRTSSGALSIGQLMKTKVHFHKPGENYKTENYISTPNTMNLLEKHLKETKGRVRTRFPPEPNGILHVGHAKAININFGYAMAHDGDCILRYDDTNPEKEEEKFFKGIKEMVEWLGYSTNVITHSSDYFDQLYVWARELICKGHAYVCHQQADDLKGFDVPDSPWRERPTEESFQLFEDMKNGKFDEGEATLRMKMVMEEGKKDPVAYRIKFMPHPRTGNKWCIYPTYDYAHCLCDSIENITHSLCTTEFRSRRSSYYWLCNALGIYCPVQWEYGRLKMEYTIVSKRKISKLIDEKVVDDWNDPRLFTLSALRRRGFPAEAINTFCAMVGVSTANSIVEPSMLESCVRNVLDKSAPRSMVVLNPLKVVIVNLPSNMPTEIEVPDFPNEKDRGSHKVAMGKVIYIEENDFREVADSSYRRLSRNQGVGLRYAGLVLFLKEVVRSVCCEISELRVTCCKQAELPSDVKVKAYIHWVSNPMPCEIRLYDRLFHHKNPEDSNEVPNGFLSDCRKDSLNIINNAYADRHLQNVKVLDKFQFERVGYFCVDLDSSDTKVIKPKLV